MVTIRWMLIVLAVVSLSACVPAKYFVKCAAQPTQCN